MHLQVQPARVLSHLYTYLGRNKKLGLGGRKSRDVGILSTSKLYSLKDRVFAFTPQVKHIKYVQFYDGNVRVSGAYIQKPLHTTLTELCVCPAHPMHC